MLVAIVLTIWVAVMAVLLVANHRARRVLAPTPPPPLLAPVAEPFVDADGTRWVSALPPVPPVRPRSPRDLYGFELDAKFFAVIAPSFREYH